MTYLPLVKAGGLDPDLVVQQGQLVVPLHQLPEQDALFPDDGIVLFYLEKRQDTSPSYVIQLGPSVGIQYTLYAASGNCALIQRTKLGDYVDDGDGLSKVDRTIVSVRFKAVTSVACECICFE